MTPSPAPITHRPEPAPPVRDRPTSPQLTDRQNGVVGWLFVVAVGAVLIAAAMTIVALLAVLVLWAASGV